MYETEHPLFKAMSNTRFPYTAQDQQDVIRENLHAITFEPDTMLSQFNASVEARKSTNTESRNPFDKLLDLESEFPDCEVVAAIRGIVKEDMCFGATKYKTKAKRLKVWDDGFAKLKALGHPRLMFTKDKYWILSEKQEEALYRANPTCNDCYTEMKEANGKFGKFYFCGNKCKHQKSISDKYWQAIRRT